MGFQPRLNNVKSESEDILSENKEIMNRWKTYYEDALNKGRKTEMEQQTCQKCQTSIIGNEESEEDEGSTPPEYNEVIKSIKDIRSKKAPRKDAITSELIKLSGTECQSRIYELILKIWE